MRVSLATKKPIPIGLLKNAYWLLTKVVAVPMRGSESFGGLLYLYSAFGFAVNADNKPPIEPLVTTGTRKKEKYR